VRQPLLSTSAQLDKSVDTAGMEEAELDNTDRFPRDHDARFLAEEPDFGVVYQGILNFWVEIAKLYSV